VDVCGSIQYLHEQDIVHGDIKGVGISNFFSLPKHVQFFLQDNVLIDNDCRPRLSDFGLASFDRSPWLGVTPDSSDTGGTTAYMAPELFHREYAGEGQSNIPLMRKEADIYALGMLIYEVRHLIVGFRCRTLNHLSGPDREKAIP